MIRVLNILSDTNIGGAGRVILNYLQFADKERFEPHVAVPAGSLLVPEFSKHQIPVHEIQGIADRSFDRKDIPILMEVISSVGPDIVHTHGSLSGRIAAKRCGCKIVYTRHSAFPVSAKLRYPPGRWVNKWVNEYYADQIIAISPAAAENLTDSGISEKKITTMMNGVAPLTPAPPERRQALREELGLAQDDFVLGILARIEPYKGHLTIAQAAGTLKNAGRRFKILVAGTGSYEDELRDAIRELGLEDTVLLLGFRTDISELLSVLDCQLNASYGTETSSLAILEGMSLGLPSIVSDYGGNPVLITQGDNGLIFPAQDSQALALCITRLMDDPELLKHMGQRGKEIFFQRYTGQIYAQNVERVYIEALKGASQ